MSSAVAAALISGAAVIGFSYVPALFVWAAFIGWASYDHSGANWRAALQSSAALVFGVVMAWLVAISAAAGALPLATPIATATSASVASLLIVLASRLRFLSVVPATFYGFASTFAYLSLAPGAFAIGALTALTWRNPIATVSISLLIGTCLGILHGRLAAAFAAGHAQTLPAHALGLGGAMHR